ncbi:pyruvate kinase [Desulfovibrio inopinatus]|uniref:pyruvate kinase n=1 Tax=Desulfovibrio inopinatus TaxID=102109 RepID=UPI00041B3733|nr:pyruvate kinase [Desulfovibrio inopinatus]
MHVKIIATLGPASMHPDTMWELVDAGVRIFRFNFSHSHAAAFAPHIATVRKLEKEFGFPITAMGDLCGPKIRIGEVKDSPRQVFKDETLFLGAPGEDAPFVDRPFISLDIPELLAGLSVGMPVNLSDGLLQFKVSEVLKKDRLYALHAQNAGMLTSNKGICFPGKYHPLPALTEKDIRDVHEGIDVGIDAFAISFVQSPDDVLLLRKEMQKHGKDLPIVAKLERRNAVDRLDDILEVADAIMVARGDLGLECPLEELPVIQKKIIRACRHAQKPSIVATQMLLSMVDNPIPTRAEATDVANAIMDGADCVMLSEETAVGRHPVGTVKVMHNIADHAIGYYLQRIPTPYPPGEGQNVPKYLAYAACLLAQNMKSPAMVCHSTSGLTARFMSSRRPKEPVHALTTDEEVLRGLNFSWGVTPHLIEHDNRGHMKRVEDFVEDTPDFERNQAIILTAGQPTPGQPHPGTNNIKIYYK